VKGMQNGGKTFLVVDGNERGLDRGEKGHFSG